MTDEVTEMYSKLTTDASADELEHLMSNSNVESLTQVYDTLVRQNYTPEPESPSFGSRKRPGLSIKRSSLNALAREQSTSDSISSESLASTQMDSYELDLINGNKIRPLDNNNLASGEEQLIHITKHPDEPLGMTVKEENGRIEVARILVGSRVHKENLLHVGDVILSVDNKEVKTPEAFISIVKKVTGSMVFRVIPSYTQPPPSDQCYLRALFTYDPSQDTLLPCNELGLSFVSGEVIEVLNRDDQNWWQARRLTEVNSPVGLIPSQELEEMRRAFVPPEFDYSTKITICGTRASKKKRKEMYQLQQYSEFDRAEIQLYEEVCRMPPFERKTLVLIGAQGVGRRTLKARLIAYDPDRFATPLPHTSRPMKDCEVDGKQYHFVKREVMDRDILEGKYLESGELQGHLYGIKLDSIRAIIRSGKMCIIDCNPQVSLTNFCFFSFHGPFNSSFELTFYSCLFYSPLDHTLLALVNLSNFFSLSLSAVPQIAQNKGIFTFCGFYCCSCYRTITIHA